MKGLILVGGHGTRLRPLSYTRAKQLIPIANKPVVFYAIEDMKNAGITDIGLVVGHDKERIEYIKNALGDGNKFGVKFTYIEQDAPRGLAHAVMISKEFLQDDKFILYLGDNVLKGGINNFVRDFENSDSHAKLMLTRVDDPSRYGIASLLEEKVIKVIEKPNINDSPSNLGIVGIYGFTSKIFDAINKIKPSQRKELEITDAIQELVNNGHTVKASLVSGWWKDTGKPEDILEANRLVLEDLIPYNNGKIEDPSSVRLLGNVGIGNDTVVHQNCQIEGPVIIGENCEIGPNTRIGPNTSIGNKCIIKGCNIENSVLFEGVFIDTDKTISNSLIGHDAKITNASNSSFHFFVGDSSSIHV